MIIGPVLALGTAWKQRKDIVDTVGTVNKKRRIPWKKRSSKMTR